MDDRRRPSVPVHEASRAEVGWTEQGGRRVADAKDENENREMTFPQVLLALSILTCVFSAALAIANTVAPTRQAGRVQPIVANATATALTSGALSLVFLPLALRTKGRLAPSPAGSVRIRQIAPMLLVAYGGLAAVFHHFFQPTPFEFLCFVAIGFVALVLLTLRILLKIRNKIV
jgi:hypothetical protein